MLAAGPWPNWNLMVRGPAKCRVPSDCIGLRLVLSYYYYYQKQAGGKQNCSYTSTKSYSLNVWKTFFSLVQQKLFLEWRCVDSPWQMSNNCAFIMPTLLHAPIIWKGPKGNWLSFPKQRCQKEKAELSPVVASAVYFLSQVASDYTTILCTEILNVGTSASLLLGY